MLKFISANRAFQDDWTSVRGACLGGRIVNKKAKIVKTSFLKKFSCLFRTRNNSSTLVNFSRFRNYCHNNMSGMERAKSSSGVCIGWLMRVFVRATSFPRGCFF